MGVIGSSVGLLARYLIAIALWIVWVLLFIPKAAAPREKSVVKDRTARWGMIIEAISYSIVWSIPSLNVALWRVAVALVFGATGILTTYFAIRHLDRLWRFDAALSENHMLVRTGPYSVVRHPIYAGMFAMLFAWGFLLAPWWTIGAAIVPFVLGTEIRVRTEDRLLRARFGEEFETYARRVSAYVPFVR